VVSAGGRLSVALYSARHVNPGEELTFNYACVTEVGARWLLNICTCSLGSHQSFWDADSFSNHPNRRHATTAVNSRQDKEEFLQAICLCSTRDCRESFLSYAGSNAFDQVMAAHHTFMHRQVGVLFGRGAGKLATQADARAVTEWFDQSLTKLDHGATLLM
jgi:hypothetical protein